MARSPRAPRIGSSAMRARGRRRAHGGSRGTDEERAYYASSERYTAEETEYQLIQGTKPQSLAYGLTDSPVGVAAWVVEKLRGWSDCKGNPENAFTKDCILTLVSIYWYTRTIGTAVRIYYSSGQFRRPPAPRNVGVGMLADVRSPQPQPRPQQEAAAGGRRVPQACLDFYGITSRAGRRSRSWRHGSGACQAVVVSRGRRSFSGSRSTLRFWSRTCELSSGLSERRRRTISFVDGQSITKPRTTNRKATKPRNRSTRGRRVAAACDV